MQQKDEPSLQALLNLRNLPDDIQGLYAFFLRQIKQKLIGDTHVLIRTRQGELVPVDGWSAVDYPLLATLAVVREPVTLEFIKKIAGIPADMSYLIEAKERLRQFLDVVKNRYRLYHATLPEFLTSEHTKKNAYREGLYVDAKEWHGTYQHVLLGAIQCRLVGVRCLWSKSLGSPFL